MALSPSTEPESGIPGMHDVVDLLVAGRGLHLLTDYNQPWPELGLQVCEEGTIVAFQEKVSGEWRAKLLPFA